MAQNQDEHISKIAQDLQLLRIKRNGGRALDNAHLLKIPLHLTPEFNNALREKLEPDVYPDTPSPFKSPRELVSILVAQGDATNAKVKTLFEKQYELEWHTLTGDPDQFSFYGFCKDIAHAHANANAVADGNVDAGGENVMTYDTRRAHVNSRLYHAQQQLLEIRRLTFQKLCPPVYVRTTTPANEAPGNDETWRKWVWDNNAFIVTEENANIDWISNEDLRNHITENSKSYDNGNFPNESHLYWAVLEEDDFENPLFKTQVYVGKASDGIRNRWVTGSKSHCKRMKFARDVMCEMSNYSPAALRWEQLVDLRFLLHKACNKDGENSGLFIMRYEGNLGPAETSNINGENILFADWKPKNMKYGMNA
jgi:hypothetical protein